MRQPAPDYAFDDEPVSAPHMTLGALIAAGMFFIAGICLGIALTIGALLVNF